MANVFDQFDTEPNVFDQFDDVRTSPAPDIPPVPGGQWMSEDDPRSPADLYPGAVVQDPATMARETPVERQLPGQSVIEPALTVATGAAAPMVAGAAGAADLLNPFTNIGDTAKMVEDIQEAMTFIPRGTKSLENLQSIADALEPVTKAAETVEEVAGESGFQAAGAAGGALAKAAPAAIMTALGAPNIRKAISAAEKAAASLKESPLPAGLELLKPKSKFKQKTIQRIRENAANPELASDIRLVAEDINSGKIKDTGTAMVVLEDEVRKTAGNKAADDVAEIAKDIGAGDSTAIARLEDVAREAAEPAPERSLAKFIEDGAGSIKKDPIAKEAVKQGFDEGIVAAMKGASKTDKSLMRKMAAIMKKGKENARFAVLNRPSNIAGESFMKRLNNIRTLNRSAGSELDSVAKNLKGQAVDSSGAIGNFMDNLDEMGVSIDGNLKPIFKNSDVEFNSGSKQAIAGMIKRLSRGKPGVQPDAFELHRMKRLIDDMVTYGKSGEGIKGKTERVLKQLRRDIDGSLDANFPDYDRVNTQYSDTIDALDSFQDVAGKKMDLSGGNSDKAVGTLLRRLMSNAQSRVNLIDSVDKVDSINKKYDAVFDDDIQTLMLFADELDEVFGPVARTSLASEVGKGVRKAAQADVKSAAADVAAAGVDKLRGVTQENRFKVLFDLLERN